MKIKRLGRPATFYNQTVEMAQENLDRMRWRSNPMNIHGLDISNLHNDYDEGITSGKERDANIDYSV